MKFRNLLLISTMLFSLSVNAQNADDIRGGWIADLDGTRHVYLLVVRGEAVTGIYCTDCSDPQNLAFVENGVLDNNGLRFNVSGAGKTYTDSVQAELINGELHVTRGREGARGAGVTMVMHRSPAEENVAAAPPGGFEPPPAYLPPAPPEELTTESFLGLWLFGSGPGKQYFMFKQHGDELLGMVCGQCNDTSDMAVLDNIRMDGTNLYFDIVHEDSGPGIVEHGPHKNVVSATISMNEMHISVVPSFEPATFTPIEMTMLGPIRYRP